MQTFRFVFAVFLVLPLLVACGGSSDNSDQPPGDLSVTSVSPDRGSMSGGYRAQVKGSGFNAGVTVSIVGLGFSNHNAGQPTVMFGTQQSIAPQVVNDTLIFATVPPNPGAGLVEVSVTNNNGTGTRPSGFLYTQSVTAKTTLLVPPTAGAGDPSTFAVTLDREAMIATGYVHSDDTGRIWEVMGVWPLEEEIR